MDDKEFETFQSVEQFSESDFEAMVTPQLLAKEDRGENLSAPFGIGLEVSSPLAVGGGKPKQPQNQRRQRGDEQQGFEALRTPPMSEGLLKSNFA